MRRQVKPFVTEYRGTSRRTKEFSSTESPTDMPSSDTRGKAFSDAQRSFADASDDSYEAALRAADALFSGSPRPSPAPSAGSGKPSPAPATPRSDTRLADEAASVFSAPTPETASAAPPRRILQAIEPEQEDRFAALEQERAPKRRGRKPGSKNRPKIAPSDDWTAIAPGAALAEPRPVSPRTRAAGLKIAALTHAPVPVETSADAEPMQDGLEVARAVPRRKAERRGRKGAELRPGERWKRRLPKAAW